MDEAESDKARLKEALRDAARRDARSAGPAPDTEALQAYLAGGLPEEEAERVRAWLVAAEESAERALELAPFVAARPPAGDAPADLAEQAGWRALQRRLHGDDPSARTGPPSDRAPSLSAPAPQPTPAGRWWRALAAVLMLTSGLLLLRVFHLESRQNPQNLRKLDLMVDARGGPVERFSMVEGEPFLVEIVPGPVPSDCDTYRVELLDLEGRVLQSFADLHLTDHVLRFVLTAQPGEHLLTVAACGAELERRRLNLVADST